MGMDINPKMVEYAQEQANSRKVSDRLRFRVMDVLGAFDLAPDSFDLVNQRLGHSYVRTWEWPFLLDECQLVSKPGGTIRLAEVETVAESNSVAVAQLGHLLIEALYEAGHSFTPDSQGITNHLARLLESRGIQRVQTHIHTASWPFFAKLMYGTIFAIAFPSHSFCLLAHLITDVLLRIKTVLASSIMPSQA
jgi:SAM-dependent methyltransferase